MLNSSQHQLPADATPISVVEPSARMESSQADTIIEKSKMLQTELKEAGSKIKEREGEIQLLTDEKKVLDDLIRSLRDLLQNYPAISAKKDENATSSDVEETIKQILQHDQSAAAILCQLKAFNSMNASNLLMTEDILGTVATLGKVDDDNLSRLLSEYLGLDTMMAVVCRTYDGVRALETYTKEGAINSNSGIHGLAASVGKSLEGRFMIISLDMLRPYPGRFIDFDAERRLEILEPRLPNGQCPPGFLGYAVNMIIVDRSNLVWLTQRGHGLRETLFYNLFGRLQVYRTRAEMFEAISLISENAISLDGGMIKGQGTFSIGRAEVSVKFPVVSGQPSNRPDGYCEIENKMKEMILRQEKILDEIQRVRQIMDRENENFHRKKQEFLKFLADSSAYTYQTQQKTQGAGPSSGGK